MAFAAGKYFYITVSGVDSIRKSLMVIWDGFYLVYTAALIDS